MVGCWHQCRGVKFAGAVFFDQCFTAWSSLLRCLKVECAIERYVEVLLSLQCGVENHLALK